MKKTLIITAAFFALTAVILGAMGAHALENSLSASSLISYKTAVRYQMWHALALLIFALSQYKLTPLKWVFILWVLGVLLFSGSIYLLSTQQATGLSLSFLGPVTPLGGALLIAGWILLIVKVVKGHIFVE